MPDTPPSEVVTGADVAGADEVWAAGAVGEAAVDWVGADVLVPDFDPEVPAEVVAVDAAGRLLALPDGVGDFVTAVDLAVAVADEPCPFVTVGLPLARPAPPEEPAPAAPPWD